MFVVNIINYFFFFDKAGCTRCFFSKTHQSSLNLKGGSAAFPKPFSPQGTRDVPTAPSRRSEPFHFMVGGPSEVYASSGAAGFCAGMNPPC